MKRPLILTIDVGTQSLRVGLVDKEGKIVGLHKYSYNPAYHSKNNGEAEQDPNYYFNGIVESIKALNKKQPDDIKDVIGVTMDTIRDTSVILDGNYKPLHDTIVWLDQRLAKGTKKRPLLHRFIFKAIGMAPTIKLNTKKSICLWYQENMPELWAKAKHYGNISSYLTYKLTNNWADSPASIIGHFPTDFKHRKYCKSQKSLTNIYNIPFEWLPKLVQPGEILGKITKEVSKATGLKEGIPLYSCGSDKSCESLGVGCIEPSVAAISYGTAATIEVTTAKYREPEPFLPAYPACVPGYFNMDVQIYRGYWMLNWFVKDFSGLKIHNDSELKDAFKYLNKEMLKIPAGCDGLILQPYWQPGLARPQSKGAAIGFNDAITNVHFYRAIIEGIAFALRESLEHFEKMTGKRVKQIMISGGGSQSDEICQITSDIFGIPVSRVQTFETSTLGAAVAGFIAAKEFSSPLEAIHAMVHKSSTFEPDMRIHEEYDRVFYKGYKKIYPNLSKIYKNF